MSVPATLGYLDTNLFVHALYPNDPHYPRCRALLAALADVTATGWLDVVVVYELTFILARRRRFPDRQAIERYLRGILAAPGVQVDDRATLLAALGRWRAPGRPGGRSARSTTATSPASSTPSTPETVAPEKQRS